MKRTFLITSLLAGLLTFVTASCGDDGEIKDPTTETVGTTTENLSDTGYAICVSQADVGNYIQCSQFPACAYPYACWIEVGQCDAGGGPIWSDGCFYPAGYCTVTYGGALLRLFRC